MTVTLLTATTCHWFGQDGGGAETDSQTAGGQWRRRARGAGGPKAMGPAGASEEVDETMPGEAPMVMARGAAMADDMCRGACV